MGFEDTQDGSSIFARGRLDPFFPSNDIYGERSRGYTAGSHVEPPSCGHTGCHFDELQSPTLEHRRVS